MDTRQINRILSRCKATQPHYMGCFPSDRLPKCKHFPCSMVVNLDDSTKPGSHWVAIYAPTKNHVFYFDSYGMKASGKILRYLKRFPLITRQEATIQSIISDVCGQYAIFFIIMCTLKIPYRTINKMLASVKNPDIFVKDFVNEFI